MIQGYTAFLFYLTNDLNSAPYATCSEFVSLYILHSEWRKCRPISWIIIHATLKYCTDNIILPWSQWTIFYAWTAFYARLAAQAPNSPNLALSDFFLFGHVRHCMQGTILWSCEQLLEALSEIVTADAFHCQIHSITNLHNILLIWPIV
jgi:hypothetical protein